MTNRLSSNVWSATTSSRIDCGPGILETQKRADMWEKPGRLVLGSGIHHAAWLYRRYLLKHEMQCDDEVAPGFLEEGLLKYPAHPSLEQRIRRVWGRWTRNYLMPANIEGFEIPIAVHWSGRLMLFDAPNLDHDTGDKPRAARTGVLARAQLDGVYRDEDGVLVVEDLKSGDFVPSESALRNMRQPQFYPGLAAMAFGLGPDESVAFVWHSMPYGQQVRVEFGAMEAMDNTLAWLDVFRSKDRLQPDHEYWTRPRRNPGCDLCPAKRTGCSEWAMDLDNPRPVSDVAILEEQLAWARAELRERLTNEQEVVDGGYSARWEPKEQVVGSGLDLLEWCEKNKVEPHPDWFRVDLVKLRRKTAGKGLGPEIDETLIKEGVLRRKPAGSALVIEATEESAPDPPDGD